MLKKKKQKRILWIGILLIFLILLVVFLLRGRNQTPTLLLKKDLTAEVGETIKVSHFIEDVKNGSLVSKDQKMEATKLGKQKITVEIKNKKGKKMKQSFSVKVIDTKKPEISGVKNWETVCGEEIDLLEGITVVDLSKEAIQATIEGKYHFDKVGTYSLFYLAKDSSGNETKVPFELVVKEKGKPAFDLMRNAASKEGISLSIISGFRSYTKQKNIYNNYVARDGREEADTYSARPGHSEHQTGLAMDINSLEVSFEDTEEGKWLNRNCSQFGFVIRYPKGKSDETGYMYEPWHIRYVGKKLAKELYNNGNWITMETYFGLTSQYE